MPWPITLPQWYQKVTTCLPGAGVGRFGGTKGVGVAGCVWAAAAGLVGSAGFAAALGLAPPAAAWVVAPPAGAVVAAAAGLDASVGGGAAGAAVGGAVPPQAAA